MAIVFSRTRLSALPLAILLVGSFPTRSAHAEGPAVSEAPPPKTSVYTQDGRLGSIRPGASVGVGAPDGVRFGVFAKWRGLLEVGGAFSMLPQTKVPGLDAEVLRVSGEGFARVHPFRGALFLGVAGGYAQTKGTLSEETTAFKQPQRVETHAYASAIYVAPQLGFQWMLAFGMTVGIDIGVEIPLTTSGPTFDASKYGLVVPVEGKGGVADATRRFTSAPVPVIHLLEIGMAL